MRVACAIALTDAEREQLVRWARGRRTPVRLAQRAQMVLLAAEGKQNRETAAEVGDGP
jgi:DNA-binding CsgD family transcriptional regulator